MAQTKLTYSEKSNPVSVVNRKTQATAEDFNEIKSIVNANADDVDDKYDELVDAQVSGYLVYANYSDLPTEGEELVSYKVANDSTDSDLNGFYYWDGTEYQKDAELNEDIVDNVEALETATIAYGEEVTESSTIENYYIAGSGTLTANTSYNTKVYDVSSFDNVRLAGIINGNVAQYAFFSEETCDTLVSVGTSDSFDDYSVNRILSSESSFLAVTEKIGDEMAVYSISDTIKDYAYALEDKITKLTVDASIYGEKESVSSVILSYYMNASGTLVSSSSYNIKVYDVSSLEKVRIAGIFTGNIAQYAFFSEETCDTLVSVGTSGSYDEDELNKEISVLGDYLAITTRSDNVSNVYSESDRLSDCTDELESRIVDLESNALDVIGFGDSLTAGYGGEGTTYLTKLKTLLGYNYNVKNMGVGGETTLTIGWRHGGISALLESDITLPATVTAVQIGTSAASGMLSGWDDAYIDPLLQGSSGVNPVIVDGVECTLSYTDEVYYLTRSEAGDERTLYAGTPIFCYANKRYNDVHCQIIYIGTNGSWSLTPSELIEQIEAMINFSVCTKFIVVGIHYRADADLEDLESEMTKAFGNKYFNTRMYMIGNGLTDAGITATDQDIIDVAAGEVPDSLRYDSVHFNATGYELLGAQIFNLGENLGYW